jgi:hypothetical protein
VDEVAEHLSWKYDYLQRFLVEFKQCLGDKTENRFKKTFPLLVMKMIAT